MQFHHQAFTTCFYMCKSVLYFSTTELFKLQIQLCLVARVSRWCLDEGGVWMKVEFFFYGNLERLRHRAQLQTADGDCPSTFNIRTNVEFVRNAQADGHNDAGAHRCSSSLSLFSPNSKTRQTKVTAEVQNHQAKSQNPGKEKQKVHKQTKVSH